MRTFGYGVKRLGITLAAAFLASPAFAGTTAYDIRVFLAQEHPFTATPPATIAPPVSAMQLRQPARMPPATIAPSPGRPAVSPTVAERMPVTMPQPSGKALALHEPAQTGLRKVVSEIRVGALLHDHGPFSSVKEGGYNVNLEVLFVSPEFLSVIWSPRPHLGGSVNLEGNTSQAYFGLSWEWSFWDGFFAGFSFGGSYHNGKLRGDRVDRKALGCRLLFRESIEIGYRFGGRHSISLMLDHISNGRLCSKNDGHENFGIRYGYRF
jgi:lipid A 3-O-deacylase